MRTRGNKLVAATLALVVAVLSVVPGSGTPAGAGSDPDTDDGKGASARKVLVVTAPGLRWNDLVEGDLVHIESFLAESSTALLSLRTIGARTGLGEGYITIGTGNRASARTSAAGLALEPAERFESGTAAEAFERRTGLLPTGALLHLGFPSVVQTNERFLYGAEPGSLGTALADAGRRVAVIANGDLGLAVDPGRSSPDDEVVADEPEVDADGVEGEETVVDSDETGVVEDADDVDQGDPQFTESDFGRSAALALMDDTGQVPLGSADGLLVADPDAPYGVRYDADAVIASFRTVWPEADVALVELSDLDRADAYRREADPAAASELWQQALTSSDALFGSLLDEIDRSTTTVILATPAAPRSAESLGVFGMATGDGGGLAQSGTTRRAGYVTLADLAPTVLRTFDVDIPKDMTGTIIAKVDSIEVDEDRFVMFADATERAVFRDRATGPISVVFVIVQILAYGLAAVAVSRRRHWVRPVSFLALVVLATPTVGFMAGALEIRDADLGTYGFAIFGSAITMAALAEGLAVLVARRWPRTRALLAPLALVACNWLLLVVDITTGGRLQIDTVFGYSPIVAGRFAGFGNLAFALIAVGAVVVACGGWATYRLTRGAADGNTRLQGPAAIVIGLFLAVTVIVDGAPAWGSDVGGVLATVPAFIVLVLVARGVRIDLRRGAIIGAITVVVLGVFAGIDLARAEEDRTHLGRLVARVFDSDGGGLVEVIQRKLNTNINILTSSIWTLTIPFALGLMVFLARRDRGFLRDLQEEVPGIKPMLAGGLLVAVLGFALNDSGVAVPAMMFAVLLPYLTYVLLRWDPAES